MAKTNKIFETINSIPALLSRNFRKFAKKPAMILDGGRTISYNDMRWDIFKTANILRFFSGAKPKTVAIFIDNSPQTVETLYSIMSIGAKAVLLRYTMSKAEIATALDKENPDVIFIRNENMGVLPENLTASVLEMADNRVLKILDKEVHDRRIQKVVTHTKDEEQIFAVTYSHGMESTTLRRADLANLIENKSRKHMKEKSLDALVEYIGKLVNAFINGRAVAVNYV